MIGSSLVVSPANDMPARAVENGAKLILLNQGETPFDEVADLRLWTGIGEILLAVGRPSRLAGDDARAVTSVHLHHGDVGLAAGVEVLAAL